MQRVTLIDQLNGESSTFEAGLRAEVIIERRLAEADHPRADFRARALSFDLLDESGNPIDPTLPVVGPTTVTLIGPEAAEVIERRDRWLEAIETRGSATKSVSTSTHLALVERTGSRLDDVHRLRAHLEAHRVVVPPRAPGLFDRGRIVLMAAVGLVLVVAVAAGWWLTRAEPGVIDDVAGGTESPEADEAVQVLPLGLDMDLARGTSNRTSFEGMEGQNVTILMLAPIGPFAGIDSELELLDAEGNQIAYNDDRQDVPNQAPVGFNGLDSRIDVTLPADGVYTIISGDLSDTNGGRYRLIVEEGGDGGDGFNGLGPGGVPVFDEAAMDRPAEDFAVAVRPGVDVPPSGEVGCGYLETAEVSLPFEDSLVVTCDVAVLVFGIEESSRVMVIASSTNADPIVWLLTENGEPIAHNDDSGGLNSRLDVELEQGRYLLEVGNLQREEGRIDVLIEAG